MHRLTGSLFAFALLVPVVSSAQDASRTVAGGGITVAGWQGTVDPKEAAAGMKIENAKFAKVHEHYFKFMEEQVLWFRVAEGNFDTFMQTGRRPAGGGAAPKKA